MWDVIGGMVALLAAIPGVWLLYAGRRERLRGQAEKVTAWSVREVRSNERGQETPPSGVVVVNSSSGEVREVAVKVLGEPGEPIPGKRYNSIAPGFYYWKYQAAVWSAPVALSTEGGLMSLTNIDSTTGEGHTISMLPITEFPPKQQVVLLRFRTSNGRRWFRLSGGEVEPEYVLPIRAGSREPNTVKRIWWKVLLWWRKRWNGGLREELEKHGKHISDWDAEFQKSETEVARPPDFAARVSKESNQVAALLRRALATLGTQDGDGQDPELHIPAPEDRDRFAPATVEIGPGTVLPPTIVAARASGPPGRALVFATKKEKLDTGVYYFQAATEGPLPAEFYFGNTKRDSKKDNVNLRKAFIEAAELRNQPGGGTAETWKGHEKELMDTIAAAIATNPPTAAPS